MPFNLDDAFGVHAQAMMLREYRAGVLATNLANADTPNYKAKDIDFKEALKSMQGDSTQMKTTHAGHIGMNSADSMQTEKMYRVPVQPSVDGNTVDTEVEQAQFSQNAVQYQASLSFLDGKIKGLISAIRGD